MSRGTLELLPSTKLKVNVFERNPKVVVKRIKLTHTHTHAQNWLRPPQDNLHLTEHLCK